MAKQVGSCFVTLGGETVTEGFNGDGSDTLRVPHRGLYAGKRHVRFDEGAGVSDIKGRSALLYTLDLLKMKSFCSYVLCFVTHIEY